MQMGHGVDDLGNHVMGSGSLLTPPKSSTGKGKRRGTYTERTQEEKLEIGEYAAQHGVTAASNRFKDEAGKRVPLATVSNFKKMFLAGKKEPDKRGRKPTKHLTQQQQHLSRQIQQLVPSNNSASSSLPEIKRAKIDKPSETSWRRNLDRHGGGFWGDARWNDLHMLKRMPLVKPMMEELLLALPPTNGLKVADICSGTGRATLKVLSGYPDAIITMIEQSDERIGIAQAELEASGLSGNVDYFKETIDNSMEELPGAPYDLVVASLALHVLAEKPAQYARGRSTKSDPRTTYKQMFQTVYESLNSGGHLIIADHSGVVSLFPQMKMMEDAGYTDVDCSWRQDDYFVYGGMKP